LVTVLVFESSRERLVDAAYVWLGQNARAFSYASAWSCARAKREKTDGALLEAKKETDSILGRHSNVVMYLRREL